MPKISVIVPVYKVEPYLRRCVDSILNQTFQDFELILVDDGSPDGCPAICDEYAIRDSRVRVIHQKNGGLSAARNAGIDWSLAHSDSEWLTFVDSDDWIHPQLLNRLFDAVHRLRVKIAACGFQRVEQYVINTEQYVEPKLISVEEFYLVQNLTATIACAKLYYKECFDRVRYPVGRLHEDEFTTYKLLFAENTVAVVPNKLYYYFTNPSSIMGTSWKPARMDAFDAYRQQFDYFRLIDNKKVLCAQYVNCLKVYSFQIEAVQKCSEYKKYMTVLRKQMKKILLEAYKIGAVTIEHDAWLYEIAYPKCMKFYWLYHAALKKLHFNRKK